MKKWVVSRRDSGDLIAKAESYLGLDLALPKSAQADCVEPEEGVIFTSLGELEFVQTEGRFIPALWSPASLGLFPAAVVDEGAIRFLLNGADVMRPGIRKMDDWGDEGKTVVVREEKKGRAIAIGLSMVPSQEAKSMNKGPCLKNLHYVGDRFWTLHKSV